MRWRVMVGLAAFSAILGANLTAPSGPWLHWTAKPLATGLIALMVWRMRQPLSRSYRRRVLAGLACSLVGDVLLMLPQDLFVPGLLAFLCAHLCFLAAFLGDSRLAARPWALLACLGVAALNLYLLWASIAPALRAPVIVYVLVLAVMAGQALARARLLAQRGDAQAAAARRAAAGALTFMLSDSLLAWNRFHGAIPLASVWVLSTYYLALWWIARSVLRCDTRAVTGASQ
ncbi:MAG: lysoplasmalogenase [Pseudomonadota bacterium]|nr:lysoplasmalogenase [Pseudomonadota bacterium]